MAAKKNKGWSSENETRTTGRKDSGVGNSSSGVDGIAGVGGSSGTGGVRAKVREIGDVSGIDADNAQNEAPVPGTIGKGKAGSRDKQGGPGMSGKTRGDNDEGSPSQSGG